MVVSRISQAAQILLNEDWSNLYNRITLKHKILNTSIPEAIYIQICFLLNVTIYKSIVKLRNTSFTPTCPRPNLPTSIDISTPP